MNGIAASVRDGIAWARERIQDGIAWARERGGELAARLKHPERALFWFAIVAFVLLMEPDCLAQTQVLLHRLFQIGKLLAFGLILALFVLRGLRVKWPLGGLLAFEGWMFFTTLIHSGPVLKLASEAAYPIALLMLMQILDEANPKLLFNALSVVLGVYIDANMICRLLFPNGMYITVGSGYAECWILGYDNVACVFITLGCLVALHRILTSRRKFRIWDWSVLICGVGFILLQFVVTAVFALAAFVLLFALFANDRIRARFGKGQYLCVAAFVLFFVLHFLVAQQSGILSAPLELLGKSKSFSDRLGIWGDTWPQIRGLNLLIGNGFRSAEQYASYYGETYAVHVHSYYLQTLLEGGLVGFEMLFFLIFCSMRRFDLRKHSHSEMVFPLGVFVFLLTWLLEAHIAHIRYFYIPLFLLCGQCPLPHAAALERRTSDPIDSRVRSPAIAVEKKGKYGARNPAP